MSDIVLSEKKKVNIFDKIIQSVVILVNMNKMNKAIDEHLNNIIRLEDEKRKEYEQNILKEIIFVKYQYDIMQREMYELKVPYSEKIVDGINSTRRIERLKLQKTFVEYEYDRITNVKFKTKETVKYYLTILCTVIDGIKQDIKDEGKNNRYNKLITYSTDIDTKIQTKKYDEKVYEELFKIIDDYIGYINDNYDISKLPKEERELIEFVIETMLTGVESDIDKHMYEYKVLINICKSSYRYFKIIDKVFQKIMNIYNDSFVSEVMDLKDYISAFKEIYDLKIKTKVNDVHRNISTEDEYLEYTKYITHNLDAELEIFLIKKIIECCINSDVKKILNNELAELLSEDEEE